MPPTTTTTCTRPLSSLFSTLTLHNAAPKPLRSASRSGQIRTQATSRRTTKRLRVTPGPSAPKPHATASTHLAASRISKPTNPAKTSITFTPPPSAPNPHHTPLIFLPPTDSRRKTLAPAYAVSNPYAADQTRRLPPAIGKQRQKQYNLTREQIEEMRGLRLEDPEKWTRKALAEKFGCTEFFVGIAAPSTEARQQSQREIMESAKENWGPKRRKARDERAKRRQLWASDA